MISSRYEYLRREYDSESSMDFDLAKLGAIGWLVCGVVRYNPSPARVIFMVWYARELPIKKSPIQKADKFGIFSPEVNRVGDGIGRVPGPLGDPIPWPELIPGVNPFDVDEEDTGEGKENI